MVEQPRLPRHLGLSAVLSLKMITHDLKVEVSSLESQLSGIESSISAIELQDSLALASVKACADARIHLSNVQRLILDLAVERGIIVGATFDYGTLAERVSPQMADSLSRFQDASEESCD